MQRITIVVIVGPTAIGKTKLSIKLACRIKGEIISADSMQAYRGMHILSQAPSAAQRRAAKHHLVEFLDPKKEYSAAHFSNRAARAIRSIVKKNKIPIITGGSGLYVKALLDGLFPSPPSDMKFRNAQEKFIAKYGTKKLHQRLSRIDPDAAERIHSNDARRIIRALEICHTTGRTMTELKLETHGLRDRYKVKVFGLTRPRDAIYSAIEARIDKMIKGNVIAEVKKLKRKKISRTAASVLGYKELAGYLEGEYNLETAVSLMKMNTRRFAKRQFTWFRSDHSIRWFDASKINESKIIGRIVSELAC